MSKLTVSAIEGTTASGGIISVAAGHKLKYSGGVVQVQHYYYPGTYASNATNTWTDISGFAVSITPKFSDSKMVITFCLGRVAGTNGTLLRVLRNGSTFSLPNAEGSRTLSHFGLTNQGTDTNHADGGYSMTVQDIPGTTSPLEYRVQFYNEGAGNHGTLFAINRNYANADSSVAYQGRSISTITVMEIAQ